MRLVTAVTCGVLILLGCGRAISTKEDAAAATHAMMGAGYGNKPPGNPIDLSITVTGKRGTATFTYDVTGTNVTMAANFKGFSADGKYTFDGTVTYTWIVSTTTGSISVAWKMVGDVTVSGEYDSRLQMDITETVSVTSLSQTSGSITVTLNGTVTANGKAFTFDNETINVNVAR